jgi:hypothetical protein
VNTLYATIAEFKAAVGVDDTVDDANIQRALDAAGAWIENYCGRVFSPQDTSLSARIFDADSGSAGGQPLGTQSGPPYAWFFGGAARASGMDRLNVPDVASVSLIELDTTLNGQFATSLAIGSWMLYPLNIGQPGVNGNYTQIRLRPNTSYAFWPGYQVRVTGLWGWPTNDAPPDPVRQATVLLANRYFRRPSAPFGVWEGPQMGNLATLPQNDPDVVQLLGAYQADSQVNWIAV